MLEGVLHLVRAAHDAHDLAPDDRPHLTQHRADAPGGAVHQDVVALAQAGLLEHGVVRGHGHCRSNGRRE